MTHEVKVKCSNCGLHYIVLSWGDWNEKHHGGYCPECGIPGSKIVWSGETDKQIFEFVPGQTEMTEMVGVKDSTTFGHGATTLSPEARQGETD